MKGFYSMFLGIFLTALLTLAFALLSIWLDPEKKLTRKSLTKIAVAMIFIFFITLSWSYTQYSEPPLPSGIDNESTNIKAALNNKGVALYMQENYTGAIKYYDKAIEIDPKYVLAWSNKGNALKALHRDIEAEKAFANAQGET
jgi:tetratricopeptide (TPR) repeat protein